jgi:hypothetical protein
MCDPEQYIFNQLAAFREILNGNEFALHPYVLIPYHYSLCEFGKCVAL